MRLDGPIAEDTDTYGRTRVGAGGQAANVAAWVVELGGRARFLGKRARDPAGRILAEELRARGVELAGPEVEAGTGTVVSIATPDGARTMLSDRGVSTEFSPGGARTGLAGRLRLAARARLQPRALAAPGDGSGRGDAGPAGQRRPLVDRRRSRRSASTRSATPGPALRPKVVFANEAEAELVGASRGTDRRHQARRAGVCRRDLGRAGRAGLEQRRGRGHDGRGDAFAAGFLLAAPTPPSTLPPAASPRWGRCPEAH